MGVMWCSWILMFMKGDILLLGNLVGPCMDLFQHLLDWRLPPAALMAFADFADLL